MTDPAGTDWAIDALRGIVNGGTGFLDGVTFGLYSGVVLRSLDLEKYVDKCSLAYRVGDIASYIGPGAIRGAARMLAKGGKRLSAWAMAKRAASCPINSFSADTPVATEAGDRPISSIKVGDKVLAYDEATGVTGYYTVTAIISHFDPGIVVLTIDDERLETTAEHPFYTQERGWVTASDLWQGAKVRKADGSYGVVQALEVVQQPQQMYNLSVAEAHTFFVGKVRLLVHNASKCIISTVAQDWAGKGAHIKTSKGVELAVRPASGGNSVVFRPVFSKYSKEQIASATKEAQEALADPEFRDKLHRAVSKAIPDVLNYPNEGGLGRSGELNFLKTILERM